jgi:hypothetical protein
MWRPKALIHDKNTERSSWKNPKWELLGLQKTRYLELIRVTITIWQERTMRTERTRAIESHKRMEGCCGYSPRKSTVDKNAKKNLANNDTVLLLSFLQAQTNQLKQ